MRKSDVAQLRAQIEAEHLAGQQALSGIAAGTARHQVIAARLERMQAITDSLAQHIGKREAMHVWCEVLEGGPLPSAPSTCGHMDESASEQSEKKE
ncbi:MAG: hypothetical protein J2P37_06800 [Ktedonobacteraceae bacterium]|nr:hypothetical protein [Ktedonobacteraceae bacterium]